MFVIMDIEWIECDHRICPTQLSAMWVNSEWRMVNRFDYLIQPFSAAAQKWNHIAYTGHDAAEFLAAPTATRTLKNLVSRLSPDDVLCWWSVSTAVTFIALYKLLLRENPVNPMRLISPALDAYRENAGLSHRGSAYVMADELGIPLFEKEHCSSDDVRVIRMLLEHLHVKQEDILDSELPEGAGEKTIQEIRKPNTIRSIASPYVLDQTRREIHLKACDRIRKGDTLKGVGTMKQAFTEKYRPCVCCRDIYWEFSRQKAEEQIRKLQLSFVYSDKGAPLFHKPSCIHVRHIPYTQIRGAVYYETCTDHGYRPCGWCKPKPSDEREPRHIYHLNITDNPELKDQWAATRTLSRQEQNALKRHAAAVKERRAIPAGLKGTKNRDAHILSQSGYAFWAAEGYQTFHLRHCPKLNHLSGLRGFSRFDQARHCGLTPCKLCRPTAKDDITASVPIYQTERENESTEMINTLCERLGWPHEDKGKEYWIETPVGIWKMIPGTQPVTVYHINKVKTPGNTTDFHRQKRLFLSMTDTVEYIRRHDESLIIHQQEAENSHPCLDEMIRAARLSPGRRPARSWKHT